MRKRPHLKRLSTVQVAELVGIAKITLERWLREGKVKPPNSLYVGAKKFRAWTERDIKRVKRYKEKHYRKGRGRKRSTGLFPALPSPNLDSV